MRVLQSNHQAAGALGGEVQCGPMLVSQEWAVGKVHEREVMIEVVFKIIVTTIILIATAFLWIKL